MNDRSDDVLERVLRSEEERILSRLGAEPGFVENALGGFTGPGGWVAILSYVLNILAFAGFLAAAYKVAGATEALAAIRWSLLALALLVLGVYFKTTLGMRNETRRVLRELRLLQAALHAGRAEEEDRRSA